MTDCILSGGREEDESARESGNDRVGSGDAFDLLRASIGKIKKTDLLRGKHKRVPFPREIPGKNKCASFQTVDTFGIFPGFMTNGAACLSGDGSTLFFTNSDGFFAGPETVQGSIATSTATGSCKDCVGSTC